MSKFDNVSMGVFREYYEKYCPNKHSDPLLCDDKYFSFASVYLDCVGVKSIAPVFFTDWNQFNFDLWPFLSVVDHQEFEKVFITHPLLSGKYSFITGYFNTSKLAFDPYLLRAPFAWDTWLVILGVFVLCCFAYLGVKAVFPKAIFSLKLGLLLANTCFGIVMSALYVSHLKAIVNLRYGHYRPFSSIEELTAQVKTGEKTLVANDFTFYVWYVLKGERLLDGIYHEKFRDLYSATKNNPPIEIPDYEQLCLNLNTNPNLVFVGRMSELEEYCSHYCFWTFEMPIIPPVVRSYEASKTSKLKKELNLCVEFMRNYRDVTIRRTKRWNVSKCSQKPQTDLIQFSSIISAVWIFFYAICVTIFVFLLELCFRNFYQYNTHL